MDINVETSLTPFGQYLAFTPDSRQLLVMDTNRNIVALDVMAGQKLSSFLTMDSRKPTGWGLSPDRNLSLSPDGTKLAVGSMFNVRPRR